MVTTERPNNHVNLVQVCSLNIEQSRLLQFTSGPALLYHQMTLIKTQTEDVQEMAKPAVQRNAFMAEPGIMLCAMLESSSRSIRSKAVETIKKLRSKPPRSQERRF